MASTPMNNEHFDIPTRIDDFYTGREDHAKRLCGWLLPNLPQKQRGASTGNRVQKRFVVYGPPGTGKLQFCSKFAEDNRHRLALHKFQSF